LALIRLSSLNKRPFVNFSDRKRDDYAKENAITFADFDAAAEKQTNLHIPYHLFLRTVIHVNQGTPAAAIEEKPV
jgi:hypothetical protein